MKTLMMPHTCDLVSSYAADDLLVIYKLYSRTTMASYGTVTIESFRM